MARTYVNLTDNIAQLREKINTVSFTVGDLTQLTTTADSDFVQAINAIDSDLGDTSSLITTDKSLVGGINELKQAVDLIDSGAIDTVSKLGDITALQTTDKSNVVSAINEVFGLIDSDLDFRNKISVNDTGGDGSLTYNSTTGVLTYTGPSASDVRAHITAGEGIDITAGVISGEDATTSNKGIASFSADNFAVSGGVVTVKNNGIILGTETTGNYVNAATGGTGITVTHTPSEGSSIGIAITAGGVSSTELASAVTFVIYNSAGTAVKTLYGAGS